MQPKQTCENPNLDHWMYMAEISSQRDQSSKRNLDNRSLDQKYKQKLLLNTRLEAKVRAFVHNHQSRGEMTQKLEKKPDLAINRNLRHARMVTQSDQSNLRDSTTLRGSKPSQNGPLGFPSLTNLLYSNNRRVVYSPSSRLSPVAERTEKSSRMLKDSHSRVSSPAFKLRVVNQDSMIAISEITALDKRSHKESMLQQAQARLDITKMSAMRTDRHKPARLKDFDPIPALRIDAQHKTTNSWFSSDRLVQANAKQAKTPSVDKTPGRPRGLRSGMQMTLYTSFQSRFLAKHANQHSQNSPPSKVAESPNHLRLHSKDFVIDELPNIPEKRTTGQGSAHGSRKLIASSRGVKLDSAIDGSKARTTGMQSPHKPQQLDGPASTKSTLQKSVDAPHGSLSPRAVDVVPDIIDLGRLQIQNLVSKMISGIDNYGVHQVASSIPKSSRIDEKAANSLFSSSPGLAKMLNNWGFINTPFKNKVSDEMGAAESLSPQGEGVVSPTRSVGHRTDKSRGWRRFNVTSKAETGLFLGRDGIQRPNPLSKYSFKLRAALVVSLREYFASLKRMGLNLNMVFTQKVIPNEPFEQPKSDHLIEAIKQGDFTCCKQLLDQNAFLVHCFDHGGLTPLHWAVLRRKHHIMLLCLSRGADVDKFDLLLLYFKADPDFKIPSKDARERISGGNSEIMTALQLADNIRTSRNLGTSATHQGCWIRAAKESFSEVISQVTSDPTNPFYDQKHVWETRLLTRLVSDYCYSIS